VHAKGEFQDIDMLDVSGKRVGARRLNVPMKDGKVTDATRIERAADPGRARPRAPR
jgi:phosphoglycerate kinase